MENKIDKETAGNEYERFVTEMDLYFDETEMDAEDLTSYLKSRGKIIRAIQSGALVINDKGEAVYTPQNARSKHPDPIVFHERTGASLMAMDGKKKNHDVAKTYSVMADMCKINAKVFAGLVGADVKVCEALFILLMD